MDFVEAQCFKHKYNLKKKNFSPSKVQVEVLQCTLDSTLYCGQSSGTHGDRIESSDRGRIVWLRFGFNIIKHG